MKRNRNPAVWLSVYVIKKIWQERIGLKYKRKRRIICRFYPDCSNYAIRALDKHGLIRGWVLAYNRIKRCNCENTESCVDYP